MPSVKAPTAVDPRLDFSSATYRTAYSRLNGIVIEGEQEAHQNYMRLAEILPQHEDELLQAARMERKHQHSFESCARHLGIEVNRDWAKAVFAPLHEYFATASSQAQVVPCLLVQSLVVECLAIALYNTYLPVADEFSRNVTEAVIQDEHQHLDFGQAWFKAHFTRVKTELQAESAQVLPIVWQILARISQDAAHLGIDFESLEEEFTIQYGEALQDIGFSFQEVLKMTAYDDAKAA